MFRQPVLVFTGGAEDLTRVRERAVARGLPVALYPGELFGTGNDDDNRAAVREIPAAGLRLAGIGLHGPRNAVDKICKGLPLHP